MIGLGQVNHHQAGGRAAPSAASAGGARTLDVALTTARSTNNDNEAVKPASQDIVNVSRGQQSSGTNTDRAFLTQVRSEQQQSELVYSRPRVAPQLSQQPSAQQNRLSAAISNSVPKTVGALDDLPTVNSQPASVQNSSIKQSTANASMATIRSNSSTPESRGFSNVERRAAPAANQQASTELSESDIKSIEQLKIRDREVRAHEAAHAAVGGSLASAPTFTFQVGPDGKRYAVGGEVQINTSPGRTPEETLEKARIIRAAANAPAEPSAQDRRVAQQAAQMALDAQAELIAADEAEREAETEEVVEGLINDPTASDEANPENGAEEEQVSLFGGDEDENGLQSSSEEEEEFVLPMFDENRRSAAEVFQEIYGKTEEASAEQLIDLSVSQDDASPLAVSLNVTA